MQPGQRVGHYAVVSHLGSGGMGAVYRATDTKLHRDVALKILPETFAADADRLARFAREAQVLASLNHPNIAAIFGVEEIPAAGPTQSATRALVMELVEGQDLSDLTTSPVALPEALRIANQLALGLQAAHEAGIVHRDLKPANVKVRPDGTVKILDFGLAKAMDRWSPGSSDPGSKDPGLHSSSGNSPTMTSPAMTELGVILGTAAYMAPEQARGRAVDRRADVWAFGCVLYEMLTGKRAFPGNEVTDVLAAIVRDDPDWSALPSSTPASIRRLLRRCLIKDKNDRLADIGVARLEIADAANPSAEGASVGSVLASSRATRFGWIGAAAIAGALVAGLAMWQLQPASPVLEERRASILIPDARHWVGPSGSGVVISPDGAWIAYTAFEGTDTQLFVQSLAEDTARLVPNSQAAYGPFFSPDSSQVGFVSRGKLWRMPIAGGSTFEVGDIDRQDRGVAWAEDGFIYSGGPRGLSRISQSGGARESLTTVDASQGEAGHRFPTMIPGQNALVFTIFKGAIEEARLAVLDIGSRKTTPLTDLPGHDARVTRDGYLIYSRGGTLMAASFDPGRRVLTSTPEPVLGGVSFNNGGATHYGVSSNGTLIYVSEADEVPPVVMLWGTRDGRTEPSTLPEGPYEDAALSWDGTRIAVSSKTAAGSTDISVWDFGRNAWVAKLTGRGYRESPVWMPDGRRLLFTYRVEGIGSVGQLFMQALEGGGPEAISDDVLTSISGSTGQFPESVTADGAKVFFTNNGDKDRGIGVLDLATRKSTFILRGGVRVPRVSPNGQFLAYVGGGTSADVYVSRLPIVEGQRWTVSAGGGGGPAWSADGRELFYQSDRKIFSVAVTSDFSARPRLVFESTSDLGSIGVHPDGRFLLAQATRDPHPMPRVVFNWIGTLARVGKAGR